MRHKIYALGAVGAAAILALTGCGKSDEDQLTLEEPAPQSAEIAYSLDPAVPTHNVPTSEHFIFAHRGLNHQAPENTLPAFQLAAEAGATWVETDIDILGDGLAVVLHDSTLDRTTNKTGSMYKLTEKDLDTLDAGEWFSEEFVGTPVPTLDEFITFLNENELNANIEIKSHEAGQEGTMTLIDQVIDAMKNLDPQREVIVSSFSLITLDRFHQKAPEYAIGVLFDANGLGDDWLSVAELVGASYIHPQDANPEGEGGLTEEQVKEFLDAGYGVNVWTVNDKERAKELLDWGVTGIYTDTADEFLDLIPSE